ncbi:MAG TPA: DUF4132 domain-containing protein [Tepidisphaeraceae bacterium]|nr:DUF4132 domain-containing protein [Tepidisphaeraceae bacterium]
MELPEDFKKQLATAEQQIEEVTIEVSAAGTFGIKPTELESCKKILSLSPAELVPVVYVLIQFLSDKPPPSKRGKTFSSRLPLKPIASAIFRKTLPYEIPVLSSILLMAASGEPGSLFYMVPYAALLNSVRNRFKNQPYPTEIQQSLRSLRNYMTSQKGYPGFQEFIDSIDEMLNGPTPAATVNIAPGEAWADAAIADLAAMPPAQRTAFSALLQYAATADGSKPSKKWLTRADELIAPIGHNAFEKHLARWLPLVEKPRNQQIPFTETRYIPNPNHLIIKEHAQLLKGLAWSCASSKNPLIAQSLADATLASFKKVPNLGPRCMILGNACLFSLTNMQTDDAAAQLGRIDAQIKQPTGRKNAAKALQKFADNTGQTPEELAEKAIPTFGLNADGILHQTFGNYTAELKITGTHSTTLTWIKSDSITKPRPSGPGPHTPKPQKSIPAEVKRDHADELKALQKTVKDLTKMLPAQRDRVERRMANAAEWQYPTWHERYFNHPLLSQLARRLIWQILEDDRVTPCAWLNGKLVKVDDTPIKIASPESARVRLWHPIGIDVQSVTAWRDWIQRHSVTQPFKQAYREVYILTDAELTTRTYSNRFATHIVRQHQFIALCQQRGWKTKLQGSWDGGDATPTLELPHWNLRAEFWIEMAGDFNESFVANYLTTDQVRFYRTGAEMTEPLELSDVPALPFSEAMRDVDLFVGVTSIGNDPTWADNGPEGIFRTYWDSFSFGALSESSKTRRAALERIIPHLKIASRCSFTDRFLVVRGDIRTYKIHFGSGNILMEPNDQYLCIVPNRSTHTDHLFLPFEGDGALSIILSKAFLLADDKKITDPTILRQIEIK